MNFKKNWKRFWTLSSAREGFTLVELIVVIAILAILAGVAVPAYSGYVKKANMQADITLISEIEHALTLAGYNGTFADGESGYITLSAATPFTSAQAGAGSNLDIALKATFGENYSLQLKYDGWAAESSMLSWLVGSHDDGSGNAIANNTYGEIVNIANSSFLTGNTTDELMTNVENLTTKLAGIVAGMDMAGKQAVYDMFSVTGADGTVSNAFQTVMTEQGYTSLENVDATTLSNLVVLAAAEEMKNLDSNALMNTEPSGMATYVALYSMYTAYAANENSSEAYREKYEQLQLDIQNESNPVNIMTMLETFQNNMIDENGNYVDSGAESYFENGLYDKDVDAFSDIMNAVDNTAIGSGDLNDPTLFTQGTVNTLFGSYVSAVEMINGMTEEEYNAFTAAQNGGVAVVYSYSGNEIRVQSSLPEQS